MQTERALRATKRGRKGGCARTEAGCVPSLFFVFCRSSSPLDSSLSPQKYARASRLTFLPTSPFTPPCVLLFFRHCYRAIGVRCRPGIRLEFVHFLSAVFSSSLRPPSSKRPLAFFDGPPALCVNERHIPPSAARQTGKHLILRGSHPREEARLTGSFLPPPISSARVA